MDTEKTPRDLDQLTENLKYLFGGYISTQKRIVKLTAIQYLAKSGGALADGFITLILVLFTLLFAAVTVALWLSNQTGSYISGFGLMTLIIAGVALLMHLFRKVLFVNPIIQRLIKKVYTDPEQSNTEENENTTTY